MPLLKSPVSQSITDFSSAQSLEFSRWMDPVGPNKGRTIVDTYYLVAEAQADISVATWEGEDIARMFGNISVLQVDGQSRWNLPGDASRIAATGLLGTERMRENADIVVANNNAFFAVLPIPMKKPFVHTPEDLSLPADLFDKVVIQTPTTADLSVGATFALDTVKYYLLADVREDLDLRLYNVDEVKMSNFKSLDEGEFSFGGKLHDMFVHARGAAGGAALANLTDVRMNSPHLGGQTLRRDPDFLYNYRFKRRVGNAGLSAQGAEVRNDPFLNGKALAVLLADDETSVWDGPISTEMVTVNMTNTVASLRAITRTIKPLSQDARSRVSAMYKKPSGVFRVATDKKSRRDLDKWPPHLHPYLPMKADLF